MVKVLTALAAVLAGGVAMAQTAAAPEWPACEVRSDGWATGSATATMRVRRDGACSVATPAANNRIDHAISAAPRNGTADASGPRTVYRPNQGFAGRDVFVVRVAIGGGAPPRYITVNVEVR